MFRLAEINENLDTNFERMNTISDEQQKKNRQKMNEAFQSEIKSENGFYGKIIYTPEILAKLEKRRLESTKA